MNWSINHLTLLSHQSQLIMEHSNGLNATTGVHCGTHYHIPSVKLQTYLIELDSLIHLN